MPMVMAKCDLPWSEVITAVDTSLFGFGVTGAVDNSGRVGLVGRLRERSRFGGPLATVQAPRHRALGGLVRAPADSDAGPDTFVELERDYIEALDWRVVAVRRWRKTRGPIHVLEESALSWGARRSARCTRNHRRRALLLSDNMSLVCAVGKGRAHDYKLLTVCRTLAGVSLSANIRFFTRWLLSLTC